MKFKIDEKGLFIIEDYNRAKSFSSFLPGIAGKYGIPLWAFFVNRGQCICSLGVKDKNHSILEFYPADKAYHEVFQKGFRTFIKTGKSYHEPFSFSESSSKIKQKMYIHPAYLSIEEHNAFIGLNTKVTYFTLPSQKVSSLIRILEITNNFNKPRNIDVLDGLPAVVPFGASHFLMKNMSRTLEAWMDAFVCKNTALFKLRVSPQDVAHTQYITGANFYFSFLELESGLKSLHPIMDKNSVFQEDVDLFIPHKFISGKFNPVYQKKISGRTPAAFTFIKKIIKPGQTVKIISFLGSANQEEKVGRLTGSIDKDKINVFFRENDNLIKGIQDKVFVKSGISEFDNYIKQSYLDNSLRGGFPQEFKNNSHPFVKYLYSRKHGDLERDYNDFRLEDTYYSSGEGNFRDVNQNRRCDNFFTPSVAEENIRLFFNLQRADGYNPLRVKPYTFMFSDKNRFKAVFKGVLRKEALDKIWILIGKKFSLGRFVDSLEGIKVSHLKQQACIFQLLQKAEKIETADFGEGFWIDHWTYNLDLVENYLAIFPDKEKQLFFDQSYSFYDDPWKVNPRNKRYKVRQGKVLQTDFLFFDKEKQSLIHKREEFPNRLRVKSDGSVVYVCFWVKLLVLVLNKLSSLDYRGVGIEMEAGKPGWCDAMNGLPALNGSSLAETLELKRLVLFIREKAERYKENNIDLPVDISEFFLGLKKILESSAKNKHTDSFIFWDRSNILKEKYREKIFKGANPGRKKINLEKVSSFLDLALEKLDSGLRDIDFSKQIPTFFINKVIDYRKKTNKEIVPLHFKTRVLPLFLEGFVRSCKVSDKSIVKRQYSYLRSSPLYDKGLSMFKVNSSLEKEPLEIGRIRVFKPGWLENESIWLHMEYKYLLELLKKGLNQEFYEEFFRCFVCFLDPAVYGRNPAENSSFIASSVYLDKERRGQGFVARLTGSTVEVLNMFVLMAVGRTPFFVEDNCLFLEFFPILKAGLFTVKKNRVEAFIEGKSKIFTIPANSFCCNFLGSTFLIYHNPLRKDTFDSSVRIQRIKIFYKDGSKEPDSIKIRNQEAEFIEAFLG
jgi:hypothetical protein